MFYGYLSAEQVIILYYYNFRYFSFTSCANKTVPGKNAASGKKLILLIKKPQVSTLNMETNILYYINLHRQSIGLPPLQINDFESSVAAQHSKNMAAGRTPFGHRGLQLRMNAIERKLGSVTVTAENVAYGQMTAMEVVDGWLHSYGHRRNIEGNFTLTGIGWAKDSKGLIYYTQIFTR